MKLKSLFSAAFVAIFLVEASAQIPNIEIKDAWVRGTVAGQKGSGAFMKITAKEGMRLTGISSPVAGVAEVHEMKMEGDVMKMRALPELAIPAGGMVDLKPGGYHLMLMDLKQVLTIGSTVPLTLTFMDGKGAKSRLEMTLPVAATAPVRQDDKR